MTKLTILFAPADGLGHFNACTGIGQVLLERGHRVVFIAKRSSWERKLSALGFDEELYDDSDEELRDDSDEELRDDSDEELRDDSDENKDEKVTWLQSVITNIAPYLRQSPLDHHKCYGRMKWTLLANRAKTENHIFKQIIHRVRPDVILIDNLSVSPSLITAGIPWIRVLSPQVLFGIDDERTPPSCSGYAIKSSRNQWQNYRKVCEEIYKDIWMDFNNFMVSEGAPPLPHLKFIYTSPFANLYMYPKEIDYTDMRPIPEKWHQFDNFLRTDQKECDELELPKELLEKPGKLIYVSMGSIACADLELMNKLIAILSKSKNKFIISKGPFAKQLNLSNNMWGEQYLPQTKVLQLVDLVLTHGGNNTITELFYYGKPIIVLPIFGDQFDNAQRVQEMGFGLSLNAYHCEENQLLEAIQTILSDKQMIDRMKRCGERIRSEQSQNWIRLTQIIENIATNK